MMARVVLYSLMRLRRSCFCFNSSFRRSRPTLAGDGPSAGAVAPLAGAAVTLAKARACANVTGPAAGLDLGARSDFRRDDLERPDFGRREDVLGMGTAFR